MSGRQYILPGVAVVLAALTVVALLAWRDYAAFRAQPLELAAARTFEVLPGESVGQVIRRLEAQDLTRHDWRWRLLLRLEPVTIRAGEYALSPGLLPGQLLELLASGKVVQYRFTVVEGWTYRQLRAALLARTELTHDPDALDPAAVMQALGSEATHPEGWFLPETYAFVRHDRALDVLARAHRAMLAALDAAWASRALGLPLDSPYEMLILASIVEKESALAEERGRIAGVFTRRLQQGWRLETDPTVIYGLGEGFDGDIRRRDLQADSDYNTYTRHGLPPTPIAMPGLGALEAVAQPEAGQAMFFVADGKGGHVFSDTLEEHNRAVQQLIQGTNGG